MAFIAEYEVITLGERNEEHVAQKSRHLDPYLLPFFGDKPVANITAGMIQDYRVSRRKPPVVEEKKGAKPVRRRRRVFKRP